MSLFKTINISVGNIKKKERFIVSSVSVRCPICCGWSDAEIDDDCDIKEILCDCDIDDFVHKDDHDKEIEEKEDEIAELQERIEELQEEIDA